MLGLLERADDHIRRLEDIYLHSHSIQNASMGVSELVCDEQRASQTTIS